MDEILNLKRGEIFQTAINVLEQQVDEGYSNLEDIRMYSNELQHYVYYPDAYKALTTGIDSNGYNLDPFDYISLVTEYEKEHFGEILTDMTAVAVANSSIAVIIDAVIYNFIDEHDIHDIEEELNPELLDIFKDYIIKLFDAE